MTNEPASPDAPLAVTFESLTGDALPASVTDLITTADTCRLRFTLEPDVFRRALETESFHLFVEMVQSGDASRLEAGVPIQIEVQLRRQVARWFERRNGPLDALLGALDGTAAVNPLLRTESWLATSVVQDVRLPADMDASAYAQVGYETEWNRLLGGRSRTPIAPVAERQVRAIGEDVEVVEAGLFSTIVRANGHAWVLLVHADEDERTCACWSVFPQCVEPDHRAVVAQFLMEANYEASVGAFEMDPADGEIRFRTSVDVGDAPLDDRLLARMIRRNIEGMGHAYPMLAAYMG